MDDLALLSGTARALERVVAGLDDSELDLETNCPPWTVRRLAGHALKNQLFWAGLVTGHDLMAQDEAMAAVKKNFISNTPRGVAMYLFEVTRLTVDPCMSIASATVFRFSGRRCSTP